MAVCDAYDAMTADRCYRKAQCEESEREAWAAASGRADELAKRLLQVLGQR